MGWGMEASLSLVEDDLPVVPHPDFMNGFNRDEGTAESREAVIKALESAIVNGMKDKEIARANEVSATDPSLQFFKGFRGQHDEREREESRDGSGNVRRIDGSREEKLKGLAFMKAERSMSRTPEVFMVNQVKTAVEANPG